MNWFRQKRIKRLVQAKMDGRITSDQEMELNQLLKKSGLKQGDFDRLVAIEKELNHLKLKDEQVDVSTRVMQAILKKQHLKEQASLSENGLAWFFGFSAVRLATIMLVGILLGSAITWMLMGDASNLDTDMLRGSMMNSELQGVSYMQQNTVVKVIPYALDNLYYLNFFIESQEEIQIEVHFNDQDFVPRKSDFIELQGAHTINTGNGSVSFAAKGRATALLILEKVNDNRAQLRVTADKNTMPLFNKQLFFN
jgi:hypothetical protein